MNRLTEPEKLTNASAQQKRTPLFSSGFLILAGGCIVLIISLLIQGESGNSQPSQPAASEAVTQNSEKVKRKELIAYLQQHPDDEFAHFQLGELIQDRAPYQALENFSHVTSQHPRYYEAVEAIAEIALEQGLNDRAISALMILVRQFPEERRFQKSLAQLLFAQGKSNWALRYARRNIELGGEQAADYLLVAEILRQAGRTIEMTGPLKQALYLEPDLYEAHFNLAYAALYSGDLETATREAKWCLAERPDSTAALRYLALIKRNQGNIEQSISYIDQALSVDPKDLECLLLKADLLIYQRKGEQAYALLKPLYPTQQTDRRYVSALARAAGLAGKREEAFELQQLNQRLIKEEDLRPSSLQSESVQKTQAGRK
ncbi:tetratricopeptide repeat protein [Gimesia algae]|uniref:Cellulose synthase subunit BcsC n=1 Tax=Gimesia algae TaxID=2527971 RepID=A0A517VG26_9PLAN|nr:tetratricopeptide repeat protein [Gimesia algae]QDT91954.1 cellulose synthase subunit BcsC [Gimesia algae]